MNNSSKLYPSVPPTPAPSVPPHIYTTGDCNPVPLEPPPPYVDQPSSPPLPSSSSSPLAAAAAAPGNNTYIHRPAVQPSAVYGAVSAPRPDLMTVPVTSLKSDPEVVQCPLCGQHVETVTEHKSGSAVAFSVLALFILGCHSGGCLVPFCCPPLKDVHHTCPACNETIAVYSRLHQRVLLGPQ